MNVLALEHLVAILSSLLTLVFVSFVLRAKRPPGNTIAWLLFLLTFPYLGIPVYIFLSRRKFKPSSDEKPGLYPLRAAKNIRLVESGDSTLQTVLTLLKSAKSKIHLTTFIFANDDVGQAVLSALEERALEGLEVRVIADSLGALWVRTPSFKQLKKYGGQVDYFMPFLHLSPFSRSNLRNHRKMLMIDGARAMIGGMNIADEYMGAHKGIWIDVGVTFEGDAVLDLETVFQRDWKFATKAKLEIDSPSPRESQTDEGIQILASGPDVERDPLYDFLLSALYAAKKRVWIATPYFIPDESLSKALELAARRGVDVQIWVPAASNHSLADLARATYLHDLFRAGAKIQYVTQMMHGKVVLIDDEHAVVGSANFDMRSLLTNFEIGTVITVRTTISQLELWFQRIPKETLQAWPPTTLLRDVMEGVGRAIGPLL